MPQMYNPVKHEIAKVREYLFLMFQTNLIIKTERVKQELSKPLGLFFKRGDLVDQIPGNYCKHTVCLVK